MKAVVNPLHLSKTYNPRSPVYYECITMVSHVTMAVTFAVARHAVHDIMVDGAGAGGGGCRGRGGVADTTHHSRGDSTIMCTQCGEYVLKLRYVTQSC